MNCEWCAKGSGRYDFTRLCCCVRIVRDSRPHRKRQEAMLTVIQKTPGSPGIDLIMEALKEVA
jgi:hypothetical protein